MDLTLILVVVSFCQVTISPLGKVQYSAVDLLSIIEHAQSALMKASTSTQPSFLYFFLGLSNFLIEGDSAIGIS